MIFPRSIACKSLRLAISGDDRHFVRQPLFRHRICTDYILTLAAKPSQGELVLARGAAGADALRPKIEGPNSGRSSLCKVCAFALPAKVWFATHVHVHPLAGGLSYLHRIEVENQPSSHGKTDAHQTYR
jgi:hypothetical protein